MFSCTAESIGLTRQFCSLKTELPVLPLCSVVLRFCTNLTMVALTDFAGGLLNKLAVSDAV